MDAIDYLSQKHKNEEIPQIHQRLTDFTYESLKRKLDQKSEEKLLGKFIQHLRDGIGEVLPDNMSNMEEQVMQQIVSFLEKSNIPQNEKETLLEDLVRDILFLLQEIHRTESDVDSSFRREVSVNIASSPDRCFISFYDLDLSAENPTSPEIEVFVQKTPLSLQIGKAYCLNSVLFDTEDTPHMIRLAHEASALKVLPEKERVGAILALFQQNMQYAYKDAVDAISDERLKEWVSQNVGLGLTPENRVPLSHIIENGYGICRFLCPVYLWLAEKAGLRGVILFNDRLNPLKNVARNAEGEKLFRSAEIGGEVSSHSWVEIVTSDGEWIPVCPSTRFAGDSEVNMKVFRDANFVAFGNWSLENRLTPEDKVILKAETMYFPPGESSSSTVFSAQLRSTKKIFGRGNTPPTNEPYQGSVQLEILQSEDFHDLPLRIIGVLEKSHEVLATTHILPVQLA